MRHISSSLVDPYSATAGAAAALYGPLHGGACEAVLKMLEDIGTVENIPGFLEKVKSKDKKLMGFGHRIYKSFDPRARLIAKAAHDVFEVCGRGIIKLILISRTSHRHCRCPRAACSQG
jgi:citrate synthase